MYTKAIMAALVATLPIETRKDVLAKAYEAGKEEGIAKIEAGISDHVPAPARRQQAEEQYEAEYRKAKEEFLG